MSNKVEEVVTDASRANKVEDKLVNVPSSYLITRANQLYKENEAVFNEYNFIVQMLNSGESPTVENDK